MRCTVRAALVARKFLIAKDGETFLQAQLEPVAAGDAVAGPVVEIFVRHHAFDGFVVGVCCRFCGCQDQAVVENIEALILHRAHVEIRHGDNVEHVEIVLAAEALFVPLHRALQAVHGPVGAVLFAVFDVDPQIDLAAGHGGEVRRHGRQVAADDGEQIRRLGECGSCQTA